MLPLPLPITLIAKVAIPVSLLLSLYFWHQSVTHQYRDEIIASINAKHDRKLIEARDMLYKTQLKAKEERLENEKTITNIRNKYAGRLRCTTSGNSGLRTETKDKTASSAADWLLLGKPEPDITTKVIDLLEEADRQNAAIVEFNKTYSTE